MAIQTTWLTAPSDVILLKTKIHVGARNLDQESWIPKNLEANLSEDERARASKFPFCGIRNRFIVPRFVGRILAAILKQEPRDAPFLLWAERQAEPAKTGTRFPEVNFNLAHANGQVVYALRPSAVGIDLEPIRDDFTTIEIAKRLFSSQEIDQLLKLHRDERTRGFLLAGREKRPT